MTSLRSLVENVEPGDNLAWVAEKSIEDVEHVYPKKVIDTKEQGDSMKVEAKGARGGRYYFTVNSSGSSEAFFVNPKKDNPTSKGPVVFAELTSSGGMVSVRRGFYDSR